MKTIPQGGDTVEPTSVDLMNAIQGLCSALEQQIETVSIDINLLRADLRKVSEKVNTAETDISAAGRSREVKKGKRTRHEQLVGAPFDPVSGPHGRGASTTHEIQTEEDDTMYMSHSSAPGRTDRSSEREPYRGLPHAAGVPTRS
ncbi:hypothetical protein NDU88_002941 [Pleurodeles waltl]|uniref:Uncharacterized protein n=1 Tax=Pleurodeles waltl TaxID=8319 RepID=A0AAV7WML2_PLEWA|nr:hypothetical protein NDU88_002941 [Pleurodeles waltl]